jgi:AcrR family transcriptional regulator
MVIERSCSLKVRKRPAAGGRRPYRLGKRTERQAETRRRIVEAALELHTTIGPLATTISAIAERAGVERLTVYRHFPDEKTLYAACTAHYMAMHPPPDPRKWLSVDDPRDRLRRALSAQYAWFADNEQRQSAVLRDVEALRSRGDLPDRPPFEGPAVDVLSAGWGVRGRARDRLRSVLGHALSFYTWRSLEREQGLAGADAVDLMVALAEQAARPQTQR